MNLIICCTPLQILFAANIAKLYKEDDFFLWVFYSGNKSKYLFYISKYKSLFKKIKILKVPHDKFKIKYFIALLYIRFLSKFVCYRRLFIANIDLLEIQFFVSNKIEVFTFDDGTANIFPHSSFYNDNISLKRKIIDVFFLNKNDLNKIKKSSKLHFTLYENEKNISINLKYLPIFSGLNNMFLQNVDNNPVFKDEISIFLGQKLNIDNNILSLVLEKLKIDFYYPHPRDSESCYNVNFIRSELIFEDYILSEIKNNPNRKYKIYTFFSGAILNIMNIPNVEIYPVFFHTVSHGVNEIYEVFERNGLSTIYIDSILCD